MLFYISCWYYIFFIFKEDIEKYCFKRQVFCSVQLCDICFTTCIHLSQFAIRTKCTFVMWSSKLSLRLSIAEFTQWVKFSRNFDTQGSPFQAWTPSLSRQWNCSSQSGVFRLLQWRHSRSIPPKAAIVNSRQKKPTNCSLSF